VTVRPPSGSIVGSARDLLTGWAAPDAEQDRLRRHFVDHLQRHADGWSRSCPGRHLTASTMIISPDGGQVLLTLHRKIGRWLQTGGHIEPGDHDLPAAALREATEESGLPVIEIGDILLLSRHAVACGPVRPTFHLDVQFLAVADAGQRAVVSAESEQVGWFAVDRLPDVDDSVRRLVEAARAAL
jgi:8-oxo-dGTP pyrophosphatase MutT (NUDIX family)